MYKIAPDKSASLLSYEHFFHLLAAPLGLFVYVWRLWQPRGEFSIVLSMLGSLFGVIAITTWLLRAIQPSREGQLFSALPGWARWAAILARWGGGLGCFLVGWFWWHGDNVGTVWTLGGSAFLQCLPHFGTHVMITEQGLWQFRGFVQGVDFTNMAQCWSAKPLEITAETKRGVVLSFTFPSPEDTQKALELLASRDMLYMPSEETEEQEEVPVSPSEKGHHCGAVETQAFPIVKRGIWRVGLFGVMALPWLGWWVWFQFQQGFSPLHFVFLQLPALFLGWAFCLLISRQPFSWWPIGFQEVHWKKTSGLRLFLWVSLPCCVVWLSCWGWLVFSAFEQTFSYHSPSALLSSLFIPCFVLFLTMDASCVASWVAKGEGTLVFRRLGWRECMEVSAPVKVVEEEDKILLHGDSGIHVLREPWLVGCVLGWSEWFVLEEKDKEKEA